jgi:hypothetical protein
MPSQGRQKACKWLVGLVLAAVYGLTASPASFALVCEEVVGGCADFEIEGNGTCSPLIVPDVCVTISLELMFFDCALDILPNDLLTIGQNDELSVILRQCVLEFDINENGQIDGDREVFIVNVAQWVQLSTVRLNKCNVWPLCLDDSEQFRLFQNTGLPPTSGSPQGNQLELHYNEQPLFNLVCGIPPIYTLAVIGKLSPGATATAVQGSNTLLVGGAFVRGSHTMGCLL